MKRTEFPTPLFTAYLRYDEASNVGVLVMTGDGSSDAVKRSKESLGDLEKKVSSETKKLTFEDWLKQELPPKTKLVVDVTRLYKAKSLLHNLMYRCIFKPAEYAVMVYEDNPDAKAELISPLRKAFGFKDHDFTTRTLRETLEDLDAPEELVSLIHQDRENIRSERPFSPLLSICCRILDIASFKDKRVIDAADTIRKAFQEKKEEFFFGRGVLITTNKVMQALVYLFLEDLLAGVGLLDGSGTKQYLMSDGRLEHIVRELFTNSREHGYANSALGMIFVWYKKTNQVLSISWDDFGSWSEESATITSGGGVGVLEIEQEIKSILKLEESKSGLYGIKVEPGIKLSDEERTELTRRQQKLADMFNDPADPSKKAQLAPIGTGHRVVLTLPIRS